MTESATRLAALPRDRLLGEFSLWSADLCRLEDEVARYAPHADLFHIDVADGHFAPAMLFFPDLVARIRTLTATPLHVHLMVTPGILLPQVQQFIEAGADLITMHAENGDALGPAIEFIRHHHRGAGLVLRLETPVTQAEPWLQHIDFLTLLGTAIGVKGQGLSEQARPRLQEARQLLARAGRQNVVRLAADGGIREHTVPLLREAGAQTVVLGSLAFDAADLAGRMAWLHALPG